MLASKYLTNYAKCSGEEYVQVIIRQSTEWTHTAGKLCCDNRARTSGICDEDGGIHIATASKLSKLVLIMEPILDFLHFVAVNSESKQAGNTTPS